MKVPSATPLDRTGLFVLETKLPDAASYTVELTASPTFEVPPDDRIFTANISLIRLVPEETAGA